MGHVEIAAIVLQLRLISMTILPSQPCSFKATSFITVIISFWFYHQLLPVSPKRILQHVEDN